MTQWHPLFAKLLRPMLESHYDVQTGMPVGDAPRLADLVLLRRTSSTPPPFKGLWRRLTVWNVLEFKGPTVSARVEDLDLLVELGLGIDRRLKEEGRKRGEAPLPRGEVSFWYLASHLGRRFLRDVGGLLGGLNEVGQGIWGATLLGRPLVLVSNRDVPVEPDTVPVHLLVTQPLETTRAVACEVATRAELWRVYGPWLAQMFPELWEEVRGMARSKGHGPNLEWGPVIEHVGLEELIRQIGLTRLIAGANLKQVIAEVGLKQVIAEVGLKQVIAEVGLKQVIAEVGLKQVLDAVGVDNFLKELTPGQRAAVKRRLK